MDYSYFLEKIKTLDDKYFYNLCFDIITANFEDSLNDPFSVELKNSGIDVLIDYFSEHEEYEKCIKLRNLKTFINKT
jgi:hypothetical protein